MTRSGNGKGPLPPAPTELLGRSFGGRHRQVCDTLTRASVTIGVDCTAAGLNIHKQYQSRLTLACYCSAPEPAFFSLRDNTLIWERIDEDQSLVIKLPFLPGGTEGGVQMFNRERE